MNADEYIKALEKAYYDNDLAEEWDTLMNAAVGITEEQKRQLYAVFPEFPKTLMDILERIDGTYYRNYGGYESTDYFFGSDVDNGEYPYHLPSFEDIMKDKDNAKNLSDLLYDYYGCPEDKALYVDDRLTDDVDNIRWLCFSDCMNNGGTSSLFVDFTPSEKGKVGQIVRFLHDPDQIAVIADSFDEFLEKLVNSGMRFIDKEYY